MCIHVNKKLDLMSLFFVLYISALRSPGFSLPPQAFLLPQIHNIQCVKAFLSSRLLDQNPARYCCAWSWSIIFTLLEPWDYNDDDDEDYDYDGDVVLTDDYVEHANTHSA